MVIRLAKIRLPSVVSGLALKRDDYTTLLMRYLFFLTHAMFGGLKVNTTKKWTPCDAGSERSLVIPAKIVLAILEH